MRMAWKHRWWYAVFCSALLAPVAAAQGRVTQAIVQLREKRRGESAIAWVQDSGTAGSIIGRVVTRARLSALADAVAQVEDTTGHMVQRTRLDADGAFRFAALRPGTYRVSINRIGYAIARGNVMVSADGSVRLTVLMAEQTYY